MAPLRSDRALAWIIALGLAAIGLLAWWEQRAVFDDAYISFRYAQNAVAGHGLVFDAARPDEIVEGFSNPLWVALAVVAIGAGFDPLTATRVVGLGSYAALLAVIGYALARGAAPLGRGALALLPALMVLVLPQGFAAMAGSGLATAFVSLCLVALGAAHLLPEGRAASLLRVLAGALAVWTRMDALIGVLASILASWIGRLADERRRAVRESLELGASAGVALAALIAARLAYYGEWLPNPYYAKGADGAHWAAGLDYLATFLWSCPAALILLVLAGYALLKTSAGSIRRALLYGLVGCGLYAVYIARVGGDFMQYRFVWQFYPLLAACGLFGLIVLARRSLPGAGAVSVVLALSSLRPPVLELEHAMQSIAEMDTYAREGREVGERIAAVLPPGTVIATTLAGTVPYFSGLESVDQWGLNHRDVARGPALATFLRGHYKPVSAEFLRSRGVELVINHPTICACDDLCVEDAPMLFVRLDAERCLQTFVLEPRPALIERACADPLHFVLHRIRCVPDARKGEAQR